MKIEDCKFVAAVSSDGFGEVCTCIKDKGHGNGIAANDVDEDYESLLLTSPKMYALLERLACELPNEMTAEYYEIMGLLAEARGETPTSK